jgi:hypothetical protein
MGARVYMPMLGRFLQVDSVEGGTLKPYVYAHDPVNFADYTGQSLWGGIKALAGAVLKAVVIMQPLLLPVIAVAAVLTSKTVTAMVTHAVGGGQPRSASTDSYNWGKLQNTSADFRTKVVAANKGKCPSGCVIINQSTTVSSPANFDQKETIGKYSGNLNGTMKTTTTGWSFQGTLTIKPEKYDYNIEDGKVVTVRNIGTATGAMMSGSVSLACNFATSAKCGLPHDYYIIFDKPVTISEEGNY